MKVLITGFDPFGGESINPALEAVKQLPDTIAGSEVIKIEIPTVFRKSLEIIEENIIKHNPDIVISVGQAGGRVGITPERVAVNIDDARIPDNESNQPIDLPIFEDGENAYFSTLPIKAMVEEMKAGEIPGYISNTAGTFVCNHVMYGILYMAAKKYPKIKGGFIHVPYIPSQVLDKPSMPSMSISNIVEGLTLCIKAAVSKNEDVKVTGGTIC